MWAPVSLCDPGGLMWLQVSSGSAALTCWHLSRRSGGLSWLDVLLFLSSEAWLVCGVCALVSTVLLHYIRQEPLFLGYYTNVRKTELKKTAAWERHCIVVDIHQIETPCPFLYSSYEEQRAQSCNDILIFEQHSRVHLTFYCSAVTRSWPSIIKVQQELYPQWRTSHTHFNRCTSM